MEIAIKVMLPAVPEQRGSVRRSYFVSRASFLMLFPIQSGTFSSYNPTQNSNIQTYFNTCREPGDVSYKAAAATGPR